jgi:hypothetical protein
MFARSRSNRRRAGKEQPPRTQLLGKSGLWFCVRKRCPAVNGDSRPVGETDASLRRPGGRDGREKRRGSISAAE